MPGIAFTDDAAAMEADEADLAGGHEMKGAADGHVRVARLAQLRRLMPLPLSSSSSSLSAYPFVHLFAQQEAPQRALTRGGG